MHRTFLLAAAALAACNTGFPPQYRVEDVRILAVRSHACLAGACSPTPPQSAADVSETDTLALEALVVNPLARPGLQVLWIACLPPASAAPSPCLDTANLADPSKLAQAASDPNSGIFVLGTGQSIQVPVPDVTAALQFVIDRAAANWTYECQLYREIVTVAIASAPGAKDQVALKKVRVLPSPTQIASTPGVQNHYALNLNPTFDPPRGEGDVRLQPTDKDNCVGGSSIVTTPFPPGKITICGLAGSGSVGAYEFCDPNNPPHVTSPSQESLDWQWYVTAGDFPSEDGGVGNAAGGNVDFERPQGEFTMWTIVRDGRGGVDWASFAVSAL